MLTRQGHGYRARRLLKTACEKCGNAENLEAHHVDENWTNDAPGNIRTLCVTCHRAEHRGGGEKIDQRVLFETQQPQIRAIDQWRTEQRPIPSRNEAIRQLVDLGLESAREKGREGA